MHEADSDVISIPQRELFLAPKAAAAGEGKVGPTVCKERVSGAQYRVSGTRGTLKEGARRLVRQEARQSAVAR